MSSALRMTRLSTISSNAAALSSGNQRRMQAVAASTKRPLSAAAVPLGAHLPKQRPTARTYLFYLSGMTAFAISGVLTADYFLKPRNLQKPTLTAEEIRELEVKHGGPYIPRKETAGAQTSADKAASKPR